MAEPLIPGQVSRPEDSAGGHEPGINPLMSIAVLIADDHELVRSALRGVLERSGFCVAAEASTPLEAVTYAMDPGVEVLLLDLSWASCANETRDEGLKILRAIRLARPSLPVLMYSAEARSVCIERCRRGGASGYLIKGLDDAVLGWAVRAVHAGEQIWSESQHARRPMQPANAGSRTVRR